MSAQAPPANPNNTPLIGAAQHINGERLTAIVWTCFSLATCLVVLRLTVRFHQNRSFLADDCWIMFAWLCLLTMSILQTEQMDSLFYTTYLIQGRLPLTAEMGPRINQLTRWQFPITNLFWTVLWSVKASFMAVFFRLVKLFPVHRRLWYCVAVFTFLAYIGCVVSGALSCYPPSDYFKAGEGKCNSPRELRRRRFTVIFSTTVDITSDLMIMALPIALLPSMELNTRTKAGLGVAFSIATLTICVAIVRMTQVIVPNAIEVDLIGLAIWSTVETTTAVIVSSLLPLKALISRPFQKHSANVELNQTYGGARRGRDDNGPGPIPRSNIAAESIPLDALHWSRQLDGDIYVTKMYETHIEDLHLPHCKSHH